MVPRRNGTYPRLRFGCSVQSEQKERVVGTCACSYALDRMLTFDFFSSPVHNICIVARGGFEVVECGGEGSVQFNWNVVVSDP